MHINPGIYNEDSLVLALNGKTVNGLSNNMRHMIKELCGRLCDEDLVKCYKTEGFIKPDIVIEVSNQKRYVSVKSGKSQTVHQELISTFIPWLNSFGISKKTQETILLYQFGDGTTDGSGKERMEYQELRYQLKERIKEANRELNSNKEFVLSVINRCIFKGSKDENQEADCIYFGDVDYGVCVSKTQMMKHCTRRDWLYMDNLHIGPLQMRPHARYIGKEINREESRQKIECYWANYEADLRYISERYDG